MTPTIDLLLAESEWAHALARALVADAATADDVVQEAWLAALRRPPRADRPLRPWLARVVRNAARQRRRGERRRAARERTAAVAEALPSADEVAARAEGQRLLIDAVLALPEPFRSVTLWHWFEGLSAAEIARRGGVPAGTVRWRLAEARARLRAELDRRHEPRQWPLLLLPLAREGAAARVASTTFAVTLWSLLLTMSTTWKLAAGAAVLVLAFTAVVLFGAPPLSQPAVPPAPAPLAARAGDEPRAATAEPRRDAGATLGEARNGAAAAAAGAAAAGRVRVAARLVDGNGGAVAGAELELRVGPAHARAAAAADSGLVSCELELPFAGAADARGVSLAVLARAPAHANHTLHVAAAAGGTVHLGDLVLHPGGSVGGRVVDHGGAPVAGAHVRVAAVGGAAAAGGMLVHDGTGSGGAEADSDETGAFVLHGVRAGTVRVQVEVDDGREATAKVDVTAGEASGDVLLRLPPLPEGITGIVLDPQGRPVPWASVEATWRTWLRSGSRLVVAGEDGRFRVPLDAGTATLTARDPRGELQPAVLEGAPRGRFVELRLREPILVPLTATAPGGGEPIAGFTFVVCDDGDGERVLQSGTAGADGSAAVRVPAQPFTVMVRAPGFAERRLGPFAADRREPITCELLPAPTFAGTVTRDGVPLAGANVQLRRVARQRVVHDGFPAWLEPSAADEVTTRADGRYVLTLRDGAGEYVVRASAPGAAAAESELLRPHTAGAHTIDLALDEGGAIEGRVVTAAGESPAGIVVAVSRGDGAARTQRTGADGVFRFERLTPGHYVVERRTHELQPGATSTSSSAGAPFAFRGTPWNCEVLAGGTTRHDVVLGDAALRGELVVDGAAAAGWRVTLLEDGEATSVVLDADGRFAVAVAPGSYRLLVTTPDGEGLRLVATVAVGSTGGEWRRSLATGSLRVRAGDERRLAVVQRSGETLVLAPVPAGVAESFPVPAGRVRVVAMPADAELAAGDPSAWPTLAEVDVPPQGSAEVRVR